MYAMNLSMNKPGTVSKITLLNKPISITENACSTCSLLEQLHRYPSATVVIYGRPSLFLSFWLHVREYYPCAALIFKHGYFLPVDETIAEFFNYFTIEGRSGVKHHDKTIQRVIYFLPPVLLRKESVQDTAYLTDTVPLLNEITHARLSSGRLSKLSKSVLALILSGFSREMIAINLKVGIRQVWLIENFLRKRWRIPDCCSLVESVYFCNR